MNKQAVCDPVLTPLFPETPQSSTTLGMAATERAPWRLTSGRRKKRWHRPTGGAKTWNTRKEWPHVLALQPLPWPLTYRPWVWPASPWWLSHSNSSGGNCTSGLAGQLWTWGLQKTRVALGFIFGHLGGKFVFQIICPSLLLFLLENRKVDFS